MTINTYSTRISGGSWSGLGQILILFILLVIVLQTLGLSPTGQIAEPPTALRTYGFVIDNQTSGYYFNYVSINGDAQPPALTTVPPQGNDRFEVTAKFPNDTSATVYYNISDSNQRNIGQLSFTMSVYVGINTRFDAITTDAPIRFSEGYYYQANQLIVRNI
ncbi:hypothetical protein [Paenibacillus herberti]|uniref:Uncharacterized protein n=1 Tax=Paenibacillus herberti TaxID=1619309 RepID=A0A229NYB7_9BACL|nr:hypothetical protein [Paenibacillus herberti]OXM14913.1 hypothetical protein CGZ75_18805 [Paenibacillus herberti]